MKRILTFLLSLTLILSGGTGSVRASSPFFVDTPSHWAEKEIVTWASRNILNGYGAHFFPENPITRAEIATIITKLMGYPSTSNMGTHFADLPQDWYTGNIMSCVKAGVLKGDEEGTIRPNDYITRQESAVLFCRALGVPPAYSETNFPDNYSIESWARPYVYALTRTGVISGTPDGLFNPTAPITRAETVALLSKAISAVFNISGSSSGSNWDKNVVVNTTDVTIIGGTIASSLIITEGVGDGDVWLDSVNVTGKLIVRGGGVNSVHISNSTIDKIEINRVDNPVSVKIESGTIGSVTIDSAGANLRVGTEATVSNVTTNNSSRVENYGTVTNFNAVGDNVTFAGNTPQNFSGAFDTVDLPSPTESPQPTENSGGSAPKVESGTPNVVIPENTAPGGTEPVDETPQPSTPTQQTPDTSEQPTPNTSEPTTPNTSEPTTPNTSEQPTPALSPLPSADGIIPTLIYGNEASFPQLDPDLTFRAHYDAVWQQSPNGLSEWTDCLPINSTFTVTKNEMPKFYRVKYIGIGDFDETPTYSDIVKPINRALQYVLLTNAISVYENELETDEEGVIYVPKSVISLTWQNLAEDDVSYEDSFSGNLTFALDKGNKQTVLWDIYYSGNNKEFYDPIRIEFVVEVLETPQTSETPPEETPTTPPSTPPEETPTTPPSTPPEETEQPQPSGEPEWPSVSPVPELLPAPSFFYSGTEPTATWDYDPSRGSWGAWCFSFNFPWEALQDECSYENPRNLEIRLVTDKYITEWQPYNPDDYYVSFSQINGGPADAATLHCIDIRVGGTTPSNAFRITSISP